MCKILIGITGGIAAYKMAETVRLFKKAGHDVRVVMSECAQTFIGAITFAALTDHPVYDDAMSNTQSAMLHIELAKWADIVLIAPVTAKSLSTLATGNADSLLATLCLATQAPCYLAPAMNEVMWHHAAVQKNIETLAGFGYHIIPPESGEQACGDHGFGRLPEPAALVDAVLSQSQSLTDVRVLITAGPTYEKIDPIRYLGNMSSGKMGYALADAFRSHGATIELISGPTHLNPPINCALTHVMSANDMLEAVSSKIAETNIYISAAAIANYSLPHTPTKLKSTESALTLTLQRTPDILQLIASNNPDVFCIGFCAESDDIVEKAKAKMVKKRCHAIVANRIQSSGYPFGSDSNDAFYISQNTHIEFKTLSKVELAKQLAYLIATDYNTHNPSHICPSD